MCSLVVNGNITHVSDQKKKGRTGCNIFGSKVNLYLYKQQTGGKKLGILVRALQFIFLIEKITVCHCIEKVCLGGFRMGYPAKLWLYCKKLLASTLQIFIITLKPYKNTINEIKTLHWLPEQAIKSLKNACCSSFPQTHPP